MTDFCGNTLCISKKSGEAAAEKIRKDAKAIGSALASLTLALLVLGVFADDHDFTLALDDLALFAHGLHGRSDFH